MSRIADPVIHLTDNLIYNMRSDRIGLRLVGSDLIYLFRIGLRIVGSDLIYLFRIGLIFLFSDRIGLGLITRRNLRIQRGQSDPTHISIKDVRKHLYWGVVIFGHFVPDSACGTHAMLFVMVVW